MISIIQSDMIMRVDVRQVCIVSPRLVICLLLEMTRHFNIIEFCTRWLLNVVHKIFRRRFKRKHSLFKFESGGVLFLVNSLLCVVSLIQLCGLTSFMKVFERLLLSSSSPLRFQHVLFHLLSVNNIVEMCRTLSDS